MFIIQIIIITCIYIEYKVIELHVIITAKQYCIAVLYTDVHILKKIFLKNNEISVNVCVKECVS